MDFIGEHLWPGRLGHLFLILSLVCSLGATICYIIATSLKHNVQYSFRVSVLRILLAAGLLTIADRLVYYFSGVKHFNVLDNSAGNIIFAIFDVALVLFVLGTIGNLIGRYVRNMSVTNQDSSVFSSVTNQDSAFFSWNKLARIFFITQVLSVFAVFGILFYIISNHYFEYKYAWQHSSLDLEAKYLLSCFWEGQEGSFLLWSVWHSVLGVIFIWRQKNWEAPVMAVVSFMQFILATMIIGFSIWGNTVGSNPFELMRNTFDLKAQIPQLNIEDNYQNYVRFITDGNGLNILLRNYWMVIHPPVLFLGFASTIIPFGFVVAGLWTKKYTEWTKPALPWALFSGGIFALGIMMGAAWAYESLNFGGYWAWDPVENASLVPWLLLVAGIHTLVIYRHTGNALRTTCLFLMLSFIFVLYSTYLTRSGDLQDTSVHAFTGDGITVWHLRILLFAFALPAIVLWIKRYKQIPFIAKEEETSAREFWMFVGSLVVFLSALMIIIMTSIPVINKVGQFLSINKWFGNGDELFHPLSVGEDSAHYYNQVQIFVAIILGLFTGFGMYLKYKSTGKPFLKKLLWPSVIGLVLAGIILGFGDINYRDHGAGYMAAVWIAVVAAVYSIVTNAAYIFSGIKGSVKKAGGAIAHLGFAMMLLGILISSSKKEVLSYYTGGIPAFFGNDSKEKPGENLTLVKGVKTDMGKYWVTYSSDSTDRLEQGKWFYNLDFESKDGKEKFSLTPNAYINPKGNEGLSANPDAKHYLTYDVFTYITSLPNPDKNKDTAQFHTRVINIGDTVFYSNGYMIMDKVAVNPSNGKYSFKPTDTALMAEVTLHSKEGTKYQARPVFYLKNSEPQYIIDTVFSQNVALAFTGLADGNKVELQVKESNTLMQYVTLKAYKFPYINVLWAGTIIMVIGFFISAMNRRERKKIEKRAQVTNSRLKTQQVES